MEWHLRQKLCKSVKKKKSGTVQVAALDFEMCCLRCEETGFASLNYGAEQVIAFSDLARMDYPMCSNVRIGGYAPPMCGQGQPGTLHPCDLARPICWQATLEKNLQ